jgi:mRNA-degrading endonuclease toxin of MazEF toxin-antitoxin module
MKAACAVNLHNTITVSQDRLGERVARLPGLRMKEICVALRFCLGCDLDR